MNFYSTLVNTNDGKVFSGPVIIADNETEANEHIEKYGLGYCTLDCPLNLTDALKRRAISQQNARVIIHGYEN